MGIQSGTERILKEVYKRPIPLGLVIEASQEIVEAAIVGYFDLISNSSFEAEEDLRSTFNFLIEFPQELVCSRPGDMKNYPTSSYTRNEEVMLATNVLASTVGATKEVYDYYHYLYRVARNPLLDREEKLKIGSERMCHETPALLNEYIRTDQFWGRDSLDSHCVDGGGRRCCLFPVRRRQKPPISFSVLTAATVSPISTKSTVTKFPGEP